MKKLVTILSVALVLACCGSAPEESFVCDTNNFSGVWHAEFALQSGNCGDLPMSEITLPTLVPHNCSILQRVSGDQCQLSTVISCTADGAPTTATSSVFIQEDQTTMSGVLHLNMTLYGSTCSGEYAVTLIKV